MAKDRRKKKEASQEEDDDERGNSRNVNVKDSSPNKISNFEQVTGKGLDTNVKKGAKKKRENATERDGVSETHSQTAGKEEIEDGISIQTQNATKSVTGSTTKKKRDSNKKKETKYLSDSDDGLDLMQSALEDAKKKEKDLENAPSKSRKKTTSNKKKVTIDDSDDTTPDLMQQTLQGINDEMSERKQIFSPEKKVDRKVSNKAESQIRDNGIISDKPALSSKYDDYIPKKLGQSSELNKDMREVTTHSDSSAQVVDDLKSSSPKKSREKLNSQKSTTTALSSDGSTEDLNSTKARSKSEISNKDNTEHSLLEGSKVNKSDKKKSNKLKSTGTTDGTFTKQNTHSESETPSITKENTLDGETSPFTINEENTDQSEQENTPNHPDNEIGTTSLVSDSINVFGGKKPRKQSRVLEKRIKKAASASVKAITKKKATQEKSVQDEDDIKGPDDDRELRTLLDRACFGFASGHLPGDFGADPTESISTTGILKTPPGKMDVHIKSLTLQAHGKHLISDSELTLNTGRRYGLIAPNGSGKSTLLTALACGLLPLPKSLSIYMLDREFKLSEMTALESVIDIVAREQEFLMREEEKYAVKQDEYPEIFNYIQMRIQELEDRNTESTARKILSGLGFSDDMIQRKTKDLSGGWRMRVSLGRVLFAKPMLMILDEPTNHLDLESVVWLEDYLVNETSDSTILLTSHSQDTLNEVCTDIIQIYNKTLQYYTGNYDTFCRVRTEREALIRKKSEALKKKMSKIQVSLGTSGLRHVQAMQRAKNIQKAKDKSDTQNKISNEELIYTKELVLRFENCGGGLPSPSLKAVDLSFGYTSDNLLFENLNFGIDLNSRIALVGVNGSGKSTLMSLMLSELKPTSGYVEKHHNLRCARFSQNLAEQLDYTMSPVSWLCSHFKEYRDQDMRRLLGRYGLTGKSQVIKIKNLSDGQRRRVLFAYIGLRNPHIIFMDEPTNALDIDTIDDLAEAINNFDGGVVMISHDFRLLDQVADAVWVIKDKGVHIYSGEIRDYKLEIKKECERKRLEIEAELTETNK